MDQEVVFCKEHGTFPAAFVCNHLITGEKIGFNQ
jgi:hypothetical protein